MMRSCSVPSRSPSLPVAACDRLVRRRRDSAEGGRGERYRLLGWKCPPNDNIRSSSTAGADPRAERRAPQRHRRRLRQRTAAKRLHLQINFNLFGNGTHTAVVRQNGVQFAQTTFEVTTFGTNFLTGVGGFCTLD